MDELCGGWRNGGRGSAEHEDEMKEIRISGYLAAQLRYWFEHPQVATWKQDFHGKTPEDDLTLVVEHPGAMISKVREWTEDDSKRALQLANDLKRPYTSAGTAPDLIDALIGKPK
jgi:hypothetical protein